MNGPVLQIVVSNSSSVCRREEKELLSRIESSISELYGTSYDLHISKSTLMTGTSTTLCLSQKEIDASA